MEKSLEESLTGVMKNISGIPSTKLKACIKTIIQKIEKKYVIKIFSGNKYKPRYLKFKVFIRKLEFTKNKIIIIEHKINLRLGDKFNTSSINAIKNIRIIK